MLAGFAFTAIVFILREEVDETGSARSVDALIYAFLALVLTSVNYAIMAGEDQKYAGGRVVSEGLFAGVAFVAAGMLLVYAVILLLDAAGAARLAKAQGVRAPAEITAGADGVWTRLGERRRIHRTTSTTWFAAPRQPRPATRRIPALIPAGALRTRAAGAAAAEAPPASSNPTPFGRVARHLRAITAVLIVPLLVFLVGPTGAQAYEEATYDHRLRAVAYWAFGVQALVSVFMLIAVWRARKADGATFHGVAAAVPLRLLSRAALWSLRQLSRGLTPKKRRESPGPSLPPFSQAVFWYCISGLIVAIAATVMSQFVGEYDKCAQASVPMLAAALILEGLFVLIGSFLVLAPWFSAPETSP